MMSWLVCAALAGELVLTEPVIAREPVQVSKVTYTSDQPIFIVPTSTFDKLLRDVQKLEACEVGLRRVGDDLILARKDQETASRLTLDALTGAGEALTVAQAQMQLDQQNDQDQIDLVLRLQADVGKAKGQRNVVLGVASGVVIVVAAGVLTR